MLKFEKIGRNDIYAVLIILLVAGGAWHIVPKVTLPEFGVAMQLQRFTEMNSAPSPHIALAAAIEPLFASLFGMGATTPEAITSFLLVFPTILLAVASGAIYLALRSLLYGKKESAFAALLFALSLAALEFLPGAYSAEAVSCALFTVFLFCFASYLKNGKALMLVPAGAFALLSSYFSPAFAATGIVAAAFFASRLKKKETTNLLPYGAIAAAFIAGAALSGNLAGAAYTLESLKSAFTLAPFVISAAAICVGLAIFGACGIEWVALVASGIILCGAHPLAGAILLILPAAEGMKTAMADVPKMARLASAYLPLLFAAYAITSGFFDAYQSLAASALVAFMGPLLIYLYDYDNKAFFAVAGALLLALSFFTAAIAQMPSSREYYPKYLDPEMASALSDLSGKEPESVIALEREDAARFYLPKANIIGHENAVGFLLDGKPIVPGGTYVLLTPSAIDELSKNGTFESYRFITEVAQAAGTGSIAFFTTTDARLIAREVGLDGSFALKDGSYVDNFGRQYATIPLSRIFLLSGNKSFSDQDNRVIVIGDESLPPHVLQIYGAGENGEGKVSEFGKVSVYRVN